MNILLKKLNFRYIFTISDVLLLMLAAFLVPLHIFINDSDYLSEYLSIEYLLGFLIPIIAIRLMLQYLFLAILAARMGAGYFGFSDINVAIHTLNQNWVVFSEIQSSYLLLSVIFLFFFFVVLIVFSKKQIFICNYRNVWIISFVVMITLLYVEKNLVVAKNIVGTSFYDLRKLSFILEPIRVIEKSNNYFDIKNPIDKKHNNIYLLIIESLGWFEDELVRNHLKQILASSGKSVQSLSVAELTYGTLGGELRELCGIRLNHLTISSKMEIFKSCAPNIAKSNGYSTTAVHPGPRSIYNRKIIYPMIGFDNYISGESMSDVPRCAGGWPTAPCDSLVLKKYFANLNGDGRSKNFYYYLSINSHHPYTTKLANKQSCKKFKIMDDLGCNYFSHLEKIFFAISELAKKNEGYFYITGDHTPPGLTGNLTVKGILPIFILD